MTMCVRTREATATARWRTCGRGAAGAAAFRWKEGAPGLGRAREGCRGSSVPAPSPDTRSPPKSPPPPCAREAGIGWPPRTTPGVGHRKDYPEL
eukprot:4219755-Prymnesium_polylepis.1